MVLIYSGADIGFYDLIYNIEGECHYYNIPTRFYPDRRTLLAGNVTITHRGRNDFTGIRNADYIGDSYETILTLVRKDNGK